MIPSDPELHDPPPSAEPEGVDRHGADGSRGIVDRASLAQQEMRLISTLVIMIGMGLFLALPFVLSIGSVVFLPLTTAVILTILLAPVADRLALFGVPNTLASALSLLVFFAAVLLAAAMIIQPAFALIDRLPQLAEQVGARFAELRGNFSWVEAVNNRLAELTGQTGTDRVVLAQPSWFQQIAIATPSVLLEVLLTFLMAFFLVEARTRLRRTLLFGRSDFGTSIKAARVLREVQDRVAAYILTVACINVGVGIIVALGAWAFGLDVPLMWGGLAMLLNFIPYIGPLAMLTLLALFGIGTSDTVLVGILPAIAFLGLHTVEANVVTPSILGARFTMNPVMILIAFSYFSWIWGAIGALLSVPILLMLTAFFDHVGRPNIVGFIFGEPLFSYASVRDHPQAAEEESAEPA